MKPLKELFTAVTIVALVWTAPRAMAETTAIVPGDQYLNFADLKSLVLGKNINSVEAALPLLSARYPEYLKFHTLMYNSLSLHESSFEQPRVLVFGPEARFILTFNGNGKQRGGNSFETLEYTNHGFQFREIAFKTGTFDREELGLTSQEIAFENQNVVISKPNPAKCLQCHGQTASPIWATYFVWPGAYGSNDDQLTMSFDKGSWNANNFNFFSKTDRPQSQGRIMALKNGAPDREVDGYIRYLQGKPAHPRYKWLPTQPTDSSFLRYAAGEPFAQLDVSAASSAERQRVHANYAWPSRPNLFLQEALMILNQDRLIARLDKAGLRSAFDSPAWKSLATYAHELKSPTPVHDLAQRIGQELATFRMRGPRPIVAEIQKRLETNLRDEMGMQIGKISLQESNLGTNSLRYLPYEEGYGHVMRFPWMKDTAAFYTSLLGLKQITPAAQIAFELETDDQVEVTMLEILLADYGIDLRDYNMNLLQTSVSFHTGGLNEVAKFLGMSR